MRRSCSRESTPGGPDDVEGAAYDRGMALAYAFIDEDGTRYGEENPAGGFTEFPYVPASGPFAGRRLMVHATSWDGFPSNTRLHASERWGCQATIEVEELLGMDPVTS